PGAEPGGGGYIAQRMLSAKNEKHAIGATFFFNIMHYAVRPWPWILVALASLVVFPDLESLQRAFPIVSDDKLGHDLAYSAMLTKLPTGLLGLVLASLVAAYMSTISTQLNWGSSYIVYDFYKQRINPKSSEKQLVRVGRLATVGLMVLSALLALLLQNALQLFEILLVFGAGTGLIFILRWFWWRINAWSEITAMFVSGALSLILKLTPIGTYLFAKDTGMMPDWSEYIVVVLVTTLAWLVATYITPPENNRVLYHFYEKIRPGGPGWNKVVEDASVDGVELETGKKWSVPSGILAMLVGSIMIYSSLFAVGYWIYGRWFWATLLTLLAMATGTILLLLWKRIKGNLE
ncbi:MAG: Na+:solute symporter, partial [Flavobacteriia bacterium]